MRDLLTLSTTIRVPAGRAGMVRNLSAATAALLGAPTLALAAPPGIYRLAFVTDTSYAATSTDITTYNGEVTLQADLNTSLPTTTWTAIASVPGTSALSNITACSTCSATVPIYLLDGTTLVGTSLADLFSGTEANTIDENEFGTASDASYVWTGSNADGSAATGSELGSAQPIFGTALGNSAYEFDYSDFVDSSSPQPLYAISGDLGSAVPEPASGALLALGGLVVAIVRRRRAATA